MDYRIWGRVEQVAPNQFLAIACAVPEDIHGDTDTRVFNEILPTRLLAQEKLQELVLQMGDLLRRRGARVTDVETDGI